MNRKTGGECGFVCYRTVHWSVAYKATPPMFSGSQILSFVRRYVSRHLRGTGAQWNIRGHFPIPVEQPAIHSAASSYRRLLLLNLAFNISPQPPKATSWCHTKDTYQHPYKAITGPLCAEVRGPTESHHSKETCDACAHLEPLGDVSGKVLHWERSSLARFQLVAARDPQIWECIYFCG